MSMALLFLLIVGFLPVFVLARTGNYLNDDCVAICGARVVLLCTKDRTPDGQGLAVCQEDTKGNVSGHLFQITEPLRNNSTPG